MAGNRLEDGILRLSRAAHSLRFDPECMAVQASDVYKDKLMLASFHTTLNSFRRVELAVRRDAGRKVECFNRARSWPGAEAGDRLEAGGPLKLPNPQT